MDSLPVVETFYSLQGEGTHTGWPAYFVRLAGCRNACPFCDTPQSWATEGFAHISVEELALRAERSGAKNCVITGGEPTLHDLTALCDALKKVGLQRWLETSGSEKLFGEFDWICLSPKKNVPVHTEYYGLAHELKVVIGQASDFEFAERQAERVSLSCLCFLQPEWGEYKRILPQIVDYAKAHPRWNLSLQMHKLIGVE